jgi:hypothetical protein
MSPGSSLSERRLRVAVGCVLVSLTVAGAACQSSSSEQELDAVFVGFNLLDRRLVSLAPGLETTLVVRTAEAKPVRAWDAGHLYLFRMPREADTEELALSTMPSRLSAAGARIVKAPRLPSDLMTATVGGPLFRIEFDWNGQRGIIYNRAARVDEKPEELLFFELR